MDDDNKNMMMEAHSPNRILVKNKTTIINESGLCSLIQIYVPCSNPSGYI
ncbi:MAG: hypothetical protein MJZ34_16675 [Paludibacteraceae bacterium]|nr:hypothetical protein [Paludibacteraceae bacterium]